MAKTPGDPQPGPSDHRRKWEPVFVQSKSIKPRVRGRRDLLLDALADLRQSDFLQFKRQLQRSLGAHRVLTVVRWEARAQHLAEILLRLRPGDASTDLAIRLLEKIGCEYQAEKLRKRTEMEKGRWEENDDELEEFFKCPQCPSEDLTIKIHPEWLLELKGRCNIYRLNCTKAGSFRCCVTDLIFDVNAPVTLIYYFDSWSQNLNEEHGKQWEIVGPLLKIRADAKEAVAAVHFPHFLCLEGKGCSEIYLAYFGEKGMNLEKPDSVGPYHVELKNLTPSPCGAVLKKSQCERKIKAHAVALLYHEDRISYSKLHFYLLPNDSFLKQAVNEREFLSHKVQSPSQTIQPLMIGSHFVLKSTSGFSSYPKKLQFKYPPTDRHIQYLELDLEFMEDVLDLVLLEDDTNDLVWKTSIKKEELMYADFHFMIDRKQNMERIFGFRTGRLIQKTLPSKQLRDNLHLKITRDEKGKFEENVEELNTFFKCSRCPISNFAENIQPETVSDPQGGYNMYRLNCTKIGSFRCCITDLIFDVRAAVTFTYYFDLWSKYLNEEHKKQWDIVGPLLNIQADPKEAVAAVHFPHFLCLEGKECPGIYLAHFVEEGMSLEKPDSVGSYHVELKNPAFSPRGVVFKRPWFKRRIKVHAVAILYQDLRVQSMKLHFYLLPNDSSLKKAVHELELNYSSQRVRKPPETKKALMIGSCFSLQKMTDVTICPEDLKFQYLPADMEQQYLELHAKDMKDEVNIFLIEKDTDAIVWIAFIRKEDLKSTISSPIEGAAAACIQTHKSIKVDASPETQEVPAPNLMSHQKSVTPGDHLLKILENLKEEDFRRFKRKLNEFPVRKGYNNIPNGRLEKADVLELVDLLCRYYTENYAIEVAAGVLEKINIKDQAEKLWKFTEMPPHPPKNT